MRLFLPWRKLCLDDALTLLDICLPELQAVLARQRRDYELSEDFSAEYPVFLQAKNIDDTPVKQPGDGEAICGLPAE